MCHVNNEKRKKANNGRNRRTKSRKIRTLKEKETYKSLEILEANMIKKMEMKKNF